VNFFRQKVLLWPKKVFHLFGLTENIAFPPLNYDGNVGFRPFSAFSACCVQHCSHSTASASVQLASLESSDPFYGVCSTRKPNEQSWTKKISGWCIRKKSQFLKNLELYGTMMWRGFNQMHTFNISELAQFSLFLQGVWV